MDIDVVTKSGICDTLNVVICHTHPQTHSRGAVTTLREWLLHLSQKIEECLCTTYAYDLLVTT